MTGTSRDTGRRLDEAGHIRQSIRDILTTPIGSRVMRREYGSLLPDLIDHPGNPANRMRVMAATVMAIARWEPRVAVSRVGFDIAMDGKVILEMDATRRAGPRAGQRLNLAIPIN